MEKHLIRWGALIERGVRNLEKKKENSTRRQPKQCNILHSKEKREIEGQSNESKYIQGNCELHRDFEGRETATVAEKNSDRKKERSKKKEEMNQKKEEKIAQDTSIESKGSFQRDRKQKNLDEINKEVKKRLPELCVLKRKERKNLKNDDRGDCKRRQLRRKRDNVLIRQNGGAMVKNSSGASRKREVLEKPGCSRSVKDKDCFVTDVNYHKSPTDCHIQSNLPQRPLLLNDHLP